MAKRRDRATRFEAPPPLALPDRLPAHFGRAAELAALERRRALSRHRAAHGRMAVPWPPSVTRALARHLWIYLESIVNEPDPDAAQRDDLVSFPDGRQIRMKVLPRAPWPGRDRFRGMLDRIIAGEPPRLRGSTVPMRLVRTGRTVSWRIKEPSYLQDDAAVRIYEFAVLLLWSPEVRSLVRRCDACRRYALLRQAKSTSRRHFCDRTCRRSWEHGADGRRENAARQAAYRRFNAPPPASQLPARKRT